MAALEMSLNFMKTVLGFWGVQDLHTVVIEGHNAAPDQAQEIVEKVYKKQKILLQNSNKAKTPIVTNRSLFVYTH